MHARFQVALLVAYLALAAALVFVDPIYPDDQWLHHIPTWMLIVALPISLRFRLLSDAAWLQIVLHMSLHAIGARWVYSLVPYDEWSRSLFGVTLSETFGWQRNHYDRLVHFSFGLFFTLPTRELVLRFIRPARGYAITIAVLFILGASAFYELLEWWIAITLAPDTADRYLGQQGDYFDAQKDMALATVASLLVAVPLAVRGAWGSAKSASP